MNYIYLDLGAYNGDSFLEFMTNDDLPASPHDFEVYLIEPNPKFHPILSILMEKFENIKAVGTAAAWLNEGHIDLAVDSNRLAYGSTIMPSKIDVWERFDKIKVECFDLSNWVKQFSRNYMIIKMDIEGAEFPILQKMITDGTIDILDQLWLETHPNKVTDYTTQDSLTLFKEIRERGVKVVEWR